MMGRNTVEENKAMFMDFMYSALEDGRLYQCEFGCHQSLKDNGGYVIEASNGTILGIMDVYSGTWVSSTSGNRKSNKRAYVNIPLDEHPTFMCAAYWFKVACDGIFQYERTSAEKLDKWINGIERSVLASDGIWVKECLPGEINHINGDSLDNFSGNLEVTTRSLNLAHSRLMSETAYHFPHLINTEIDCQGKKMHSWVDGLGVNCKLIEEWNEEKAITDNLKIVGFKDRAGEWRSRYDRDTLRLILGNLGIDTVIHADEI